jgi:hypothetical protein
LKERGRSLKKRFVSAVSAVRRALLTFTVRCIAAVTSPLNALLNRLKKK